MASTASSGSDWLKNMVAIVTGGSNSIGRAVFSRMSNIKQSPDTASIRPSASQNPNSGFPYPHLDRSIKQIRLLKFTHKEPDERLVFTLESGLLGQVSFIALSYTWDRYEISQQDVNPLRKIKEQQSQCILVNDHEFWITPSLHQFLSELTSRKLRTPRLFVDQVCINQTHQVEKEHQVSLMGEVYYQAEEVIAWLVPLSGEVNEAASVLASRSDILSLLKRPDDEDVQTQTTLSETAAEIAGDFLNNLISAYWSRQWVVQEVMLARELTFIMGKHVFDWEAVVNLAARFSQWKTFVKDYHLGHQEAYVARNILSTILSGKQWTVEDVTMESDLALNFGLLICCIDILLYKQRSSNLGRFQRRNMKSILPHLGFHECNLRRDKVFSLLYLATTVIKPDYTITLGGLYMQVLCEGLLSTERSSSSDESLSGFIQAALVACALDLTAPAVFLVTFTAMNLSGFDGDEIMTTIHYVLTRNQPPRLNAGKKESARNIIHTRQGSENSLRTIHEAKRSGGQIDMYNFRDRLDGSPGETAIESHTCDEWMELTADTFSKCAQEGERQSKERIGALKETALELEFMLGDIEAELQLLHETLREWEDERRE